MYLCLFVTTLLEKILYMSLVIPSFTEKNMRKETKKKLKFMSIMPLLLNYDFKLSSLSMFTNQHYFHSYFLK